MNRLRRALTNRFSNQRPANLEIRPGASYRRKHATNLVETAEVLEICQDHEGIPHVRFELHFGWPRRMSVAPQLRMLCLNEFTTRYGRPLS